MKHIGYFIIGLIVVVFLPAIFPYLIGRIICKICFDEGVK